MHVADIAAIGPDPIAKGRYRVRMAQSQADVLECQRLRCRAFGLSPNPDGGESDAFDTRCNHFLISDQTNAQVVATFRTLHLRNSADVLGSYSAQSYDLSNLSKYPGPLLELGRFCLDPLRADPDILRVAWAALTRMVDDLGITLLFGCSSFAGLDPAPHLRSFAKLRTRAVGPDQWRPARKAAQVLEFTDVADDAPASGSAPLPSLLRSYLVMGGWVSDHAVYDHQMGTMHVFTAVEIDAIPETRKRLLRAAAQ